MGRTARQGQEGSFSYILYEQDLINDYEIKSSDIKSWSQNQV